MTIRQRILPMIVLLLLAFAIPACSSRRQSAPAIYEPAGGSIERPAKPLDEEKTTMERAEEIATVVLVVGIVVAGIVLPILLLH